MKDLYNKMAGVYDSWYLTPQGRVADRIEREALYAFLQPHKGMKLLDIGCGTGQYSLELAQMGLDVSGADISPSMLAHARAKAEAAGLTVNFMEADAQNLPLSDSDFDLVLSVAALEFVPDLSAALQEAFRVLKAGGRLVVGLIGGNSSWHRFYAEKARQDPGSVFNHARFYTLKELLAAMPGRQVRGKEVLFIEPDFEFYRDEEVFALETAAINAGCSDGGFICAVSEK